MEFKRSGKILLGILWVIIVFRLAGYLTLIPGSVAITQVVKVVIRFSTLGITILFLFLFIRVSPHRLHLQRILPIGFYMLYLFWGMCSIFWTTNPSFTLLQLAMTIETFTFAVLYFYLLCLFDLKYKSAQPIFIWLLNRSIFVLGICFFMGYFFFPEIFIRKTHGGDVSRLGGYILNPNELGMLVLVGVSAVLFELNNKKTIRYNILAFLIAVAVLALSQSRSSIAAFGLLLGLFILKSKYIWLRVASVLTAIIALPKVLHTIILKQGSWEEVLSFTDRLPFWQDLLTYGFPKSPIIGFGFMSINSNSFTNKFVSIHAYAASMTHNTFVQVLLNLGMVGAFICLLQMLLTFHAMVSENSKAWRVMGLAMMIPLFVNSMTEFGIFGENNHGILFYQFVILFFTIKIKKV